MKTLEELLNIVKLANKKQLKSMIYDFEYLGFYREDKRQKKKFIIECLENCYTTEIKEPYNIYDSDSLWMEKFVLKAINE